MTESNGNIPKAKQTVLGLYVTAAEAYEMWKADPKNVHIVDVRTPEEYIFVGHGAMARNIPIALIKGGWDPDMNEPAMKPNPDFLASVKKYYGPADRIMVMCRSGGRSAMAANGLAKAGYGNVYNITDGAEGDKVTDPESAFNGKRMKNGWKNTAPWTYDVDPQLLGS